ncbi:MAG: hypothetical protein WA324_24080 [Bryobacteraceae bacterium]
MDYLGVQGYWVCVAVAALTLVTSFSHHAGAAGAIEALYFYLAGVGIRQRSRFAAISALLVYFISVIGAFRVAHVGILSIFFLVLLISNVRATTLAAHWAKFNHVSAPPFRAGQSLTDKFSDVLPELMWPVGRWIYYGLTGLQVLGLCAVLFGGAQLSNRS